jgi:flagellar protein FlaI
MVNTKLLEYVKNKLDKGISIEEIRNKLQKAGISKRSIDSAIKKVGKGSSQKEIRPVKEKKQENQTKENVEKKDPDRKLLLRRYIQAALTKKIGRENIKKRLMQVGWKQEDILAVFSELGFREKKQEDIEEELNKEEIRIRKDKNINILDEYVFKFMDIEVRVIIYSQKEKPNPFYHVIIPIISETTDLILEEIRLKLIDQINLGALDIIEGDFDKLDDHVQNQLIKLVAESFPHADQSIQRFLVSYLISKVLGLGVVEIIKSDSELEEIVINSSREPIYIYHKKWGWCKTNQKIKDDDSILHLASMIGRKIGKEITNLAPLLDAHLPTGDRVNATIKPITAVGPTITIRKFSDDPWTITKFLQNGTMDFQTAALIWLAIQFEMSALVVGGTASGKTSCLNVLTNLIPPNQRIVSIEDTREIRMPRYMHWVPMVSREPNSEGKGSIQMEDLLVNSLRMRPDRIIVGEVRKKIQAETLFEAIHTGHSVYATFHANDAEEALVRLTHPPISVPKTMMPAVSLLIVQFRNRRTGTRRTFQIAEITREGEINILYQYNNKTKKMEIKNKSERFFQSLELFTGNSSKELQQSMEEKVKVLKYLVKNRLGTVEEVGRVMSLYYTDKDYLMKEIIAKNKKIGGKNSK